MKTSDAEKLKNVCLNKTNDAILVLDQTRLPNETVILELREQPQIFDAIVRLCVRGAPAIGITAAYAYYLAAREAVDSGADRLSYLFDAKEYLASSRPTAVNLSWALERMHVAARAAADKPDAEFLEEMRLEAENIRVSDVKNNRIMAEHAIKLLHDGAGVLTHCNAGWLATSEYGTNLGAVYLAHERNLHIRVYADETRPLLQGARLTAWELMREGIDVTLVCDNMACSLMQSGLIDAVFVGCDRCAANGDCANKVGTAGAAVIAHHFGVPVYFFVPTSTIDMNCPSGESIVIEQRDGSEITDMWYSRPMAPEGVKTYNPAFDVTPHELITGIVTEHGIIRPPFDTGINHIMEDKKCTR